MLFLIYSNIIVIVVVVVSFDLKGILTGYSTKSKERRWNTPES
jgi:hypothetical protein